MSTDPLYPLCRVCLWRINMLQPKPVGLLGQSSLSFMLFIYTMQQSTLQFLLHCGARRCLGLQNKAPHFRLETLCIWAYCFKQGKKIERVEREKMGEEERGREKEEKRDCSSGRVQIEFHINVCKFPRSC